MRGMNAMTGRALSGAAHLHQSITRILTTPVGARLMRRTFGSALPDLIDAPDHGATRLRLYAAIAQALMCWEPRWHLIRLQARREAAGTVVIALEGQEVATHTPVTSHFRLADARGGS